MDNIFISILIPTRKRPELLLTNCKRMLSLSKDPSKIELLLYIDKDDDMTLKYSESIEKEFFNIKIIKGERLFPFGKSFNILHKHATGNICFCSGDDCEVSTKNWDELVLSEFNKVDDKILIVHGDDGFQKEKTASYFFIHKNWINTIGYVMPDNHLARCGDSWLTQVGKKIDRIIYLDNLKTKHLKYETREHQIHDHDWKRDRKIRHRSAKDFKSKEMQYLRLEDAKKLQVYIREHKGLNN